MTKELKYMKGCEICTQGLAERVDELQSTGSSVNKATHQIADEVERSMGYRLFSASALRLKFLRITGQVATTYDKKTKVGRTVQPKPRKNKEIRESQRVVEAPLDTIGVSIYTAEDVFGLHMSKMTWITKETLDILYKALAKKKHPDLHGGDGAPMAELNRCKERIEANLAIM